MNGRSSAAKDQHDGDVHAAEHSARKISTGGRGFRLERGAKKLSKLPEKGAALRLLPLARGRQPGEDARNNGKTLFMRRLDVNNKFRILWSASLAFAIATGCGGDDGDDNVTGATAVDTTGETSPGETGPDDTGGEGLPDGEQCMESSQCESGMCFVVGALGGVCGQCLGDDDCDGGGCSIPNPLKTPPEGASCNMGEQGGGCESADVCQGDQVCALILDVPGILQASTCSECNDSSQCDGETLCNPHYDVAELSGYKSCVARESVANGAGCTIGEEGNAACSSGFWWCWL